VTDCWFVGNSGPVSAGAFGCRESGGRVVRSFFYGNQVTGPESSCGGAIGITYQQGPVEIIRSAFADNRAPYGGGVCCKAGMDYPTELANCTFIQNQGTYWAGGALSVSNVKVDQRTTLGATATVTNCLFYGNTGKVDGSAMEVYAGSTLALSCLAMDGSWNRPSVVWVELDKQKQHALGQLEVNEVQPMQLLSGSPFRPEVPLDPHLRKPNPGETAHPADSGQSLAIADAEIDCDGDPVPLGSAWDIGADELNPDSNGPVQVWPLQMVFDHGRKATSDIQIYFRSARYAPDAASPADEVELVWMSGSSPRTVATIPVAVGRQGIILDAVMPEGLADGRVTFGVPVSSLPSGVYVARLTRGGAATTPKATSVRFFVRGSRPDPRTSAAQP
jgi:hypothetical protein